MKNLVKIVVLFSLLVSCSQPPDLSLTQYSFGGGVYILNEGNFGRGNGSLSFYSYDSVKIFNDLFYSVNGRPLGDVPNSMIISGGKGYIVVNNSGKIEVVDQSTIVSKATITGLISPRNMLVIDDFKAYVSSLYSDSVAIINILDNSISGYINLGKTSESIVLVGNNAYISNWVGGNKIMVINTIDNQLIDSIEVGIEPESMVQDRFGIIWVLCNGGWTRQNYAELIGINSVTNSVERKFIFPTKNESPTCLKIDGSGQTLYYLDNGVMQMDISSASLPVTPLIAQQSGEYFYKIGINPINGDIFVTDAVDFVQQGYVLLYTNNGTFISKQRAGIIPGSMCFKVSLNL